MKIYIKFTLFMHQINNFVWALFLMMSNRYKIYLISLSQQ